MNLTSALAILLGVLTATADVGATKDKKKVEQSKTTDHDAADHRLLWPVPDIDLNFDLADDEVRLLIKYDNAEGKALLESLAKDGKIDVDISKRGIASIVTSNTNRYVLEHNKNILAVEEDEILTINDGYENKLRGGEHNAHRKLSEEFPYGLAMVQAGDGSQSQPQLTIGPHKIKICVVDTGYDDGHEDLPDSSNHGVAGWDDPNQNHGVWDVDGHSHGTHVRNFFCEYLSISIPILIFHSF